MIDGYAGNQIKLYKIYLIVTYLFVYNFMRIYEQKRNTKNKDFLKQIGEFFRLSTLQILQNTWNNLFIF